MNWLRKLLDRVAAWIDEVATDFIEWRQALRPPRSARLVEQEDGAFTLERASAKPEPPAARSALKKRLFHAPRARPKPQAHLPKSLFHLADGALTREDVAILTPLLSRARVEVVLRPERFLFRPLALPRRAADFLEGIIRAQIDRLTPWSAPDVAFGWLRPPEAPGDRMTVTVAATARRLLAPYVDAVGRLGVDTVTIATPAPDLEATTIKVFEQKIKGAVDSRRLARILSVVLFGLAGLCVVAIGLSMVMGGDLEARRDAINAKIAERRAALHRGGDASSAAALALQQRKHNQPPTVLVYDELSRILPDDTYLTEMHIQGDKLQIAGISHDAPELIRVLERSPSFTHATFSAPTTRSPSDSNQHFSIEAHIEATFPPSEAATE